MDFLQNLDKGTLEGTRHIGSCWFDSVSENLKGDLDVYVKSLEQEKPTLKVVRVKHKEQLGLAHARASGWRAATAEVVAILDAHIEVHELW